MVSLVWKQSFRLDVPKEPFGTSKIDSLNKGVIGTISWKTSEQIQF